MLIAIQNSLSVLKWQGKHLWSIYKIKLEKCKLCVIDINSTWWQA